MLARRSVYRTTVSKAVILWESRAVTSNMRHAFRQTEQPKCYKRLLRQCPIIYSWFEIQNSNILFRDSWSNIYVSPWTNRTVRHMNRKYSLEGGRFLYSQITLNINGVDFKVFRIPSLTQCLSHPWRWPTCSSPSPSELQEKNTRISHPPQSWRHELENT